MVMNAGLAKVGLERNGIMITTESRAPENKVLAAICSHVGLTQAT